MSDDVTGRSDPGVPHPRTANEPGVAQRPVLAFAVGFALVVGVLEAVHLWWFIRSAPFETYLEHSARAAGVVLGWIGIEAEGQAAILSGPTGSLEIALGCEGIQPTILLVAAILAFPHASWPRRLVGAALGIVVLLILNLGRIVGLFLILRWDAETFDLMHTGILPMVLLLLSMGLWWIWMQWALRPSRPR